MVNAPMRMLNAINFANRLIGISFIAGYSTVWHNYIALNEKA